MEKVIYKITNLVNDKFYVGSTTNKKVRFRQHRRLLRQNRHHCKHLQAAWNKYGEAKFSFDVVEQVPESGDLAAVEDRYLAENVGEKHCYNSGYSSNAPWRGAPAHLTPNYGKTMSEEMKNKLREATKLQWQTSDPRTGRKHSDETRAKISARIREAVAEGRAGKFIPSEETRRKMSEALKGNQCAKGHVRSEEHRRRLSEANKGNQNWLGKKHTEESKGKMRRSVTVVYPDRTGETFAGLSELRDAKGISITTIIRACKSGRPIGKGLHAGWVISYTDTPKNDTPEIPEQYAHLPRTRQEAKTTGAKEYFTGLPCARGHVAPRKVKGTCSECLKKESRTLQHYPFGYAHSPQWSPSEVLAHTQAKPNESSDWPAEVVYKGTVEGLHHIEIDTYRIPDDLEVAVCELLRNQGEVRQDFWDAVSDYFPVWTQKALRMLQKQLRTEGCTAAGDLL